MSEVLDTEITREDLQRFGLLLSNSMGLHYPENNQNELKLKLLKVVKTFGFEDVSLCLDFLTNTSLTKKHIVSLAKELTVGETYFFRHPPSIEALETELLPNLIDQKKNQGKKLTIWSAACCTGEEPYTIAILLKSLIPNLQEWDITILGTDINQEFLEKAEIALYNEWSFRGTPLHVKQRFFQKERESKKYQLIPEVKDMVDFEYFNLIEDNPSPLLSKVSQFDLILCNNALIYFTPHHITKVTKKLSEMLRGKGWLVVSMVEIPHIKEKSLHLKEVGTILAFEKNSLPYFEVPKHKKTAISKKPLKKKPVTHVNKPINKTLKPVSTRQFDELQTLLLNQEYGKIIETLEQNLPLSSETELIVLLVKAYANQGNLLQARKWCEKGFSNCMISPTLHYLYATVLQELDCEEEAIDALKKALFLDSKFIIAHFTLGTLMMLKKKNKEGIKYFHNTLDLLKNKDLDQILPGTDDLTVGHLQRIVENLLHQEANCE